MFRFFLMLMLSTIFISCQSLTSGDAPHLPRQLVIGLDGIPYSFFVELQREGIFKEFLPPSPMVASFPSISDPNWTRLMDTPLPQGYTKNYFDPTLVSAEGRGQVIGGLLDHVRTDPIYEKGFDHRIEGVMGHVANLTWLITSARLWLDDLPDRFFSSSGKNVFYAFTLNTDLIAHTEGPQGLRDFLGRADLQIQKLRAEYRVKTGNELEVILVSDHGNDFSLPHMIDFESAFKDAGWKRGEVLKDQNSFVFVAPEILSFGSFYTWPGEEERFALLMSKRQGVHVAVYRDPKTPFRANIVAHGGMDISAVDIDAKNQTVSYRIIKGQDPLETLTHFGKSKKLTWDEYFKKSLNDNYPYAAVRVWEGLFANCQKPGSVLVSTDLGYAFSNPALELITKFKGLNSLHGSLRREETLGIFVSTERTFPPIRPKEFRLWVDLREHHQNANLIAP